MWEIGCHSFLQSSCMPGDSHSSTGLYSTNNLMRVSSKVPGHSHRAITGYHFPHYNTLQFLHWSTTLQVPLGQLASTLDNKPTACASWFLKLMVASFQFLKPLLVKARLSLLQSILLDFSADTHTHSEIQRYLGCGSGNATRATWKNRTPSTPSLLPFCHWRTITQSNLSGIK